MRRLIDRRSAVILSVFILLCSAAFAVFSLLPRGTVAVVERSGEVILSQRLSSLQSPTETKIEGENGIELTVVFYPDGAAVKESACPDKVCVGFGKLTRVGESAVCLPAKVVLRLEGAPEVDGTAY